MADLDDILSSALDDLDLEEDEQQGEKNKNTHNMNNANKMKTGTENDVAQAAVEAAAVQAKGQADASEKISSSTTASSSTGGGLFGGMDFEAEMASLLKEMESNPDFAKQLESTFQALTSGQGDLASALGALGAGTSPSPSLPPGGGGGPDLDGIDMAEFSKMMEALTKAAEGADGKIDEDALLRNIMSGLNPNNSNNGQSAQQPPSNEDISTAFMKQILNKDLMGPSMKAVSAKYPSWFSKNKSKFPAQQASIYEKQMILFGHINNFYESGDDNFERLLGMMNELQALGPPPEELMAEIGPELMR